MQGHFASPDDAAHRSFNPHFPSREGALSGHHSWLTTVASYLEGRRELKHDREAIIEDRHRVAPSFIGRRGLKHPADALQRIR